MRSTSPVSRPAWVGAMNALTGTGGASRKSPVEVIADAASVVTRSSYAEVTGISHGRLGRWTNGVAELRAARVEFATYWDAHNAQVLTRRERALQDRVLEDLRVRWPASDQQLGAGQAGERLNDGVQSVL